MTIRIFGKGDLLALPKLSMMGSPLGGDFSYTHPTWNICYSRYGFACPLTYEAIPLRLLFDNKLPSRPDHVTCFDHALSYLLVTHEGLLWKLMISQSTKEDKRWTQAQGYIDPDNGWWTTFNSLDRTTETDEFLGFLYTDPSCEAIDEFTFRQQFASQLEWFSIKDIVAKLNTDYPVDGKKSTRQDIIDEISVLNHMLNKIPIESDSIDKDLS